MDFVGGAPEGAWRPSSGAPSDSQVDDLASSPPFRVLAVVHPALSPAFLGEASQWNGRWQRMGLLFGDRGSASGPFVSVTMSAAGVPTDGLSAAVAGERDRLFDHTGLPESPLPAVSQRMRRFEVDGWAVPSVVRVEGLVWATRLTLEDGIVATVVGRGVEEGDLSLRSVATLAPFLEARDRELTRMGYRQGLIHPELIEVPVPKDLSGHEDLIRLALNRVAEPGAAVRDPAAARLPPLAGEGYLRAWEAAVRAQMRFAGQDREQATSAVTAMVDQSVALATLAEWFAEPRLRDRAIREIVRLVAFDSDVPSASAQRAWSQIWPEPGGAGRPADPLQAGAVDPWLSEWQRWARTPVPGDD